MRRGRLAALALCVAAQPLAAQPLAAQPLAAQPLAANVAPADSIAALRSSLGKCVTLDRVPPGAVGSEATVLFSVKRDGSLLGQPRITHSRLVGDQDDQRGFIAAALIAVSHCLPMPITDALGGAIAGRPLTVHLTSRKPERPL